VSGSERRTPVTSQAEPIVAVPANDAVMNEKITKTIDKINELIAHLQSNNASCKPVQQKQHSV
jgi:hypothetical protein